MTGGVAGAGGLPASSRVRLKRTMGGGTCGKTIPEYSPVGAKVVKTPPRRDSGA